MVIYLTHTWKTFQQQTILLYNDLFNKEICSWNIIKQMVDKSLGGTMKWGRERSSRERKRSPWTTKSDKIITTFLQTAWRFARDRLYFWVASKEPRTGSPCDEHTYCTMKCNREPVSRRFFQRHKWDRVISNFSSSVVNNLSAFKNEPLRLWPWNNFCRTRNPFFFKAVWFFHLMICNFPAKCPTVTEIEK